MPDRVARLDRNREGYPIPWFVAVIDGVPDFRVIRPDGIRDAIRFERCWICGQHRGRTATFVIGPMCAVNRVSAEPPSHRECAVYAAKACPFLARPNMRRRDTALPEAASKPGGVMISRNPGVALVWVTREFAAWSPARGEVLFDVGAPLEVQWLAEGREATRAEVLASIDSGLPILREEAEREGPRAVRELELMHAAALTLIPGGDA